MLIGVIGASFSGSPPTDASFEPGDPKQHCSDRFVVELEGLQFQINPANYWVSTFIATDRPSRMAPLLERVLHHPGQLSSVDRLGQVNVETGRLRSRLVGRQGPCSKSY